MICHFCREDKPLIKAHILPRPFYKAITPDGGHALFISSKSPKAQFRQAGIMDDKILCANCDNNILGKWGKYAVEFFRGASDWPKLTLSDGLGTESYYEVTDYSYRDLKLFFIAVIWRMSISNVGNFKHVRLGRHEDKAYQLLRAGDPGKAEDFSVGICKLLEVPRPNNAKVMIEIHKGMVGPNFYRNSESLRNHYRFTMGGFDIIIKVDSRAFDEPFNEICLSPDFPFRALERTFEDSWAHNYMRKVAKDHHKKQADK